MNKQRAAKNETKRDRFRRLAQSRTNQVIKRLKILGNCADRNRYEYVKEDVERIFIAIFADPENNYFQLMSPL